MRLIYTHTAQQQIDTILSNRSIYDIYGHFTQQFINWNSEFHRHVNASVIGSANLVPHGIYQIGEIGKLEYRYFTVNGVGVFEILEFRFSRLPYSNKAKTGYTIVGDGGFGYKIIQSTFNQKLTLLTLQRWLLTKFVFDNIIGFHHSSDGYNTVYAVGFIGNRVYAIYQNGDIQMMPLSKDEYLSKKHKYYESIKKRRILLPESKLKRIIQQAILEVVGF